MHNIALLHTLDFVKGSLAKNQTKILEISSEERAIGESLKRDGFEVTGFAGDLLEYQSEALFDAILVQHSLRQMGQLDKVLGKVKSLLNSTGKLFVEDFSMEKMDEKTATWFYEVHDLMATLAGDLENSQSDDLPLERWKKSHEFSPSQQTGRDLAGAIERHVGTFYAETCPYLYRYFIDYSLKLENGEQAIMKLYEWEKRLIEKKEIQPIGMRIVAKTYFSYLK